MTKCALDWLDCAARERPGQAAFEDERTCLTWGELAARARAIGAWLARRLPPGSPVAVCMEKAPAAVAAMLGALEAGCFYTIIDCAMPVPRAALIFETLRPAAILCDAGQEGRWRALGGDALCVAADAAGAADDGLLAERRRGLIDTDLQYVLFTSGSTGVPKGVSIRHRSVVDFVDWAVGALGLDAACRLGNQAPLYFDNSVLDLFCAMKAGACVHFIPRKYFLFPGRLMDYLEQKRIDTLFWVPSALAAPANAGVVQGGRPRGVKRVFFCGEVMPCRVLNLWRASLPEADYVNMYGPTEITDVCAWYRVDRPFRDDEALPIGHACDNTRITLVDGEICVSGTCLAAGYYNAPEKTAAAFVQRPDARGVPELMYRTGDLGAYNDRGELMFLGRRDSQIKRRGYRIELGEIECALLACPGVAAGCCLYREAAEAIVCFWAGEAEEKGLRGALRAALPKYMLPDEYRRLASLPMTMNGKIDRVQLRRELGK